MAEEVQGLRWRNWSREQSCNPFEIARPWTREGLISHVVEAANAERRIKVVGSGHSFSDVALGDGTLIDMHLVDRVLEVDPASRLVKVEAGIVLGELNRRLHEHGLALENLGDIDRQTVAGAISTATHGTGTRFVNLSGQIEEIELVTADGRLHRLSERSNPDAFRAARVGIGSLGAIYSVTFRTVPAFRVDRTDRPRPLAETLERMDELAGSFDHFEFYVFPHTETALCRESTRTDAPPEPESPALTYAREVVLENWIGAAFATVARRVPSSAPALARLASQGTGRSRKIDDSFRVFASERRIRFTEMEYSVPREHGREAVERVLEIAARPELAVAFPIEVRFVAGDDAWLSPSFERDTTYIAVHHDRRGDWRGYFEAVEALMAEYGGRPHWGKRHGQHAQRLAGLYPRFEDFRRVRAELDPDDRFGGRYVDRVLGAGDGR